MIEVMFAREEHLPFLQEIELEAASKISYEDLPEHLRYETVPLNEHKKAQKRGLLFVAIENGVTPVGYAITEIIDKYLHLLQIDVLPRLQRQGIGTLLLEKVVDLGIQKGLNWVSLTTFIHLPWNAPWYEKNGFKIIKDTNEPTFLFKILLKEEEMGLNPKKRVAMRKVLKHSKKI